MKIALYPGSFDPITKGHEDIIRRALPLFDKLYVAIGVNADKKYLFPLNQRKEWIENCFKNEEKAQVIIYQGLTVGACRQYGANYIVRGVRNMIDMLTEQDMAQLNKQLSGIETVLFFSTLPFVNLSSSIVRDIYLNQGDYEQFMPENCHR